MPKQVIKGASVAPVYSPATHGPGFVYVSGQIGLDPASGTLDLAEGVVEQAEQAFRNTLALLERAGSSPGLICKMNVFVNDRAHLVRESFIPVDWLMMSLFRFCPCACIDGLFILFDLL